MDDISRYNQERWEDLARNNIEYSRPYLTLTPERAREVVDPYGMLGEIAGRDVLALASGGGQQSVAFAMLGARVTVIDFSETQLERDRAALAHHGLEARLEQGDMRDLSRFDVGAFDVVWQAHSINFIPDPNPVFEQVARVIRPGGLYRVHFSNPFQLGCDSESWNGRGYVCGGEPYRDGELQHADPTWAWREEDCTERRVRGPREFRHTLSTMVNGLIGRGFRITGLREEQSGDLDAAPGSWDHFVACLPPWLHLWACFEP